MFWYSLESRKFHKIVNATWIYLRPDYIERQLVEHASRLKRKEKKREHCVWNWIINFQKMYTSSITVEHASYTYNVSSNLCTQCYISLNMEKNCELRQEKKWQCFINGSCKCYCHYAKGSGFIVQTILFYNYSLTNSYRLLSLKSESSQKEL